VLRVLVCSCSFRFYPLVGVSPCGWCRSLLFCDVLFVCVAGSVTLFAVGCCYTADCVVLFTVHGWFFRCVVAVHCKALFILLIGVTLHIAIPLQ